MAYNRGFRLLGTPLGFGGKATADLRFIPSLDDSPPPRRRRAIATRLVVSALALPARGVDALGLDFGQTIRLGRMEIQLFPTGMGPGSAQLRITFKGNHILYCGGVCLRSPLTSQPAEIPACDLLLLDAVPAAPHPPAPRRVAPRLASWAEQVLSEGRIPAVGVGSTASAFDVLSALAPLGVPVRAARRLFEIIRRTEADLSLSSSIRRLDRRLPRSGTGVVMYPARQWSSMSWLEERSFENAYAGPGKEAPAWASAAFRLGESEDRAGIVSYVKQTGASKVALGATGDDRLAAMLAGAGIDPYRVVPPVQMPLMF